MTVTPTPSPGPAPSPSGPTAPPKPAAQTIANHWRLGADLDGLRANATTWKTLSTTVRTEKSTFTAKVEGTMPHWKADNGADFAASYATPQGAALTDLSGACLGVHGALTSLAGQLEDVQGELDASLNRLKAAMPVDEFSILGISPVIVFHPQDADDEKLIQTETKTAEGLLDDAKDHVSQANSALNKIPETFTGLKSGWADESATPARWTKHPAGSSSYRTVQTIDGVTVVSGTGQDEKVRVEIDPDTGETVLVWYRINKVDKNPDPDVYEPHYEYVEEQRIRVPADQQVVINTGDGNDQVEVPKGVNVKIRVVLGGGDDQVHSREADSRIEAFAGDGADRVITGHGADFISSGDGDDYVDGGASADQAFGSGGNDVLYGMDGNDTLSGGDGRDYIDGGAGSDLAFGGGGADQVGGGHDGDDLFGGAGSDHVYGGHGDDHADGGIDFDGGGNVVADDDQLTVGKDDTTSDVEEDKTVILEYNGDLGTFIKVEGSPEFQARVNSDLEFLRSTPTGQEMLRKLTEQHEDTDNPWNPFDSDNTYTIKEFDPTAAYDNAYESGGDGGSDVTVTYRPEWTGLDGSNDDPSYDITPPVVVLYHEMGHSYQFMGGGAADGRTLQDDGTSVNSLERQNVGLSYADNDRSGDDEGLAPDTDPDPDQHVYRENGLRDEIGIPRRTEY